MHISPSGKRYIGITSKKKVEYRWNNGKGYSDNPYFTRAINKYGWNNFEHIIICRGLSKEEAQWLEIELIREWDSTNRDKGYNITKGGEGANGLVHTEEWKQQQSERFSGENNPMYGKGYLISGENHPNWGKHHSEETRRKISENHADISGENNPKYWLGKTGENHHWYGKHHSEESRKKMSENHWDCSGENHPSATKVICTTTNKIFNTIKEAMEYYNIKSNHISDVCNGDRKSCGKLSDGTKLVWMFYKDYLEQQNNM